MTQFDPLAAALEGGVESPVMVLAPTRDVVSPWIVYGEGCVLDAAKLDAAGLATWQASGKVTSVLGEPQPPGPQAPVLSDVTATPDAADGTLATITWTTDVAADSQVHYGLSEPYDQSSAIDSAPVTSHSVALTGLTAATTYHFAAASGGVSSADGTFATAA
jgi:hypothetical protein